MTEPLTPPDCDLRDFARMMIDIPRLFGSEFDATANDSEWRFGVTLWLKSFHQVPAASLPDDDAQLARLCGLGRDVKTWRKAKAAALRGWERADDGLLYHPVVAEIALEAWLEKLTQRLSSGAGNAARWKTEFDPEPIRAEIGIAAALLEALNPKSKALSKQQPALALRKSRRDTHAAVQTGPPEIPAGSQGKGREEKEENRSDDLFVASAEPTATEPVRQLEPWDRDHDFGKLWDAAPPQMRKRAKSKAKVWPEWRRAAKCGLPSAIVAGFIRYKALDADLARTGGPGLHIWLKDRTWEQWVGDSATDLQLGADWPASRWRVAVELFRGDGSWDERLGPKPGEPGCRVAPEIQREFSVEPAQPQAAEQAA
jgi:hypothetical protein